MTIVVKIGGSLMRDTPPRALLARIARHTGVIVVPGGGTLADGVRAIQPHWGLTDSAAHRMALLAMEQMAHAFADLAPSLIPVRSRADLAQAGRKCAALWFPAAMTLGRPDIGESWDVTSDSLALWLAAETGAHSLVLVKAAGATLPAPAGDRAADIAGWTQLGLVDAAFANMAQRFQGGILLVAADDGDTLDLALHAGDSIWADPALAAR